jgi:hypothetical protein
MTDEERGEISEIPMNNNKPKSNINLLLNCVKTDDYCFTLLDYLKKMLRFSQIDYYSAYTQILYCFKPKEMYNSNKVVMKWPKLENVLYFIIRSKESMGKR